VIIRGTTLKEGEVEEAVEVVITTRISITDILREDLLPLPLEAVAEILAAMGVGIGGTIVASGDGGRVGGVTMIRYLLGVAEVVVMMAQEVIVIRHLPTGPRMEAARSLLREVMTTDVLA
jgi:hypothetical protein